MSRAYKNKKYNKVNYLNYGKNPKYFGLQATRYPGSIKKQFCNTHADYYGMSGPDVTITVRRSPAVYKNAECVVFFDPVPEFGPTLEASIIPPVLGPSNMEGLPAPGLGPTGVQSTIITPALGPSALSSNLTTPAAGPASISSQILVPQEGPQSVTSSTVNPPVGGPAGLSSTAVTIPYAEFVAQPWANYTALGGPILGNVQTINVYGSTDNTTTDANAVVGFSAPYTFVYTQTWGFQTGGSKKYRATFQRWHSSPPGTANVNSPSTTSTGPYSLSSTGRTYTIRPKYTTVQIN